MSFTQRLNSALRHSHLIDKGIEGCPLVGVCPCAKCYFMTGVAFDLPMQKCDIIYAICVFYSANSKVQVEGYTFSRQYGIG